MPLPLTWVLGNPLVFAEEAAEHGPALDPLKGEVGHWVVGPGRAELTAAMGSSSVVVRLALGQDRPQMSFTEDQHPVGDLRPGSEHEPFRVSVGRRRRLRLMATIGTGVCG